MAVDFYLKLEGIKGESQDAKHEGEIDVLAWSWGCSQSGTTHMGGGSGSGKANFQDISVTKWVDKASHNLLKHVANGIHIKSANLVARKAGGSPLEYIKIDMKNVLITSVSTGGSGGEDRLTENITLNFEEFKYTYTPQKADGSGDSPLPFAFNIMKNKDA